MNAIIVAYLCCKSCWTLTLPAWYLSFAKSLVFLFGLFDFAPPLPLPHWNCTMQLCCVVQFSVIWIRRRMQHF